MLCVTLSVYVTLPLYTEIVLLHYTVKEFPFYSNNSQGFVFMAKF
jgi:hypothetical protein